jgi:hypothetical protein
VVIPIPILNLFWERISYGYLARWRTWLLDKIYFYRF